MTLKALFEPFVHIGIKGEKLTAFLVCVPKINLTTAYEDKLNKKKDFEISFKCGQLIYVGEANNIKSRYDSHINDKINKTSSLKLGLRNERKDNLGYFYIEVDSKEEKTALEKFIRDTYHPWFGD